jgi:hypothetical protein
VNEPEKIKIIRDGVELVNLGVQAWTVVAPARQVSRPVGGVAEGSNVAVNLEKVDWFQIEAATGLLSSLRWRL